MSRETELLREAANCIDALCDEFYEEGNKIGCARELVERLRKACESDETKPKEPYTRDCLSAIPNRRGTIDVPSESLQ